MTYLTSYLNLLEGCRFCPMCKPANEVQNALYLESVSTRARALMLWVHLNSGQVEYDKREVEILYQSTLDSISEAWCRSHYNVSGYIQAARADLVSTQNVPDHIKEWGNRPLGELEPAGTSTVFFLGEAGYLGEAEAEKVSRSIHGKNEAASVIRYPNGAIEYALGFTDRAREILTAIQSCLSEVDTVVVDGPSTWYALEKLGPELGVSGIKKPVIKTLVDVIAEAGPVLNENILPRPGAMVFYHDGRYPFYLTDSQVDARVITPEFDSQNETWLGSGAVFDGPRELIRQSGLKITNSFWTRNLSRSSGADDGLFITYPEYAALLGNKLVEYAVEQGGEAIITSSILDAAHLRGLKDNHLPVIWLPELFRD